MINLIDWFLDKLIIKLEPVLERLVRAAVEEAISEVDDRLEMIPSRIVAAALDAFEQSADYPGKVGDAALNIAKGAFAKLASQIRGPF